MNKYSEKYIYHYCSLETLLSIIKTRKIWFSDLKESNDASEDKALDHLLEIDKNNNILKKEMIKAKQMTSIFGFCLTFKGDNYELWRIYTDNKGVCLKFKKSQFKKFYSNLFGEDKDVYDLQYGKIKYDDIDSQINPSDINYQNISKIYSDFLLNQLLLKRNIGNMKKNIVFALENSLLMD